jgi:PAS domain S-box-containing protein
MFQSSNPRVELSSLSHQQTTLRGILAAGMAAIATMMVFSLAMRVSPQLTLGTYGAGLLLHAFHLQWLRRTANVRRVAISHCVSYLVWVTLILAVRYQGLRGPAALVYPPLILVTGLVWSGRAAMWMACASSVLGGALVVLEKRHLLGSSPELVPPERLWIVLTGAVFVTAVVLRYALGIIQRSIDATLQSDQRYAELVESAPDAMLFCDAQGKVRVCNLAASKLWGYERSKLLGQAMKDLFADPGEARRLSSVRSKASTPAFELEIKTRAGDFVPVELRVRSAPSDDAEPGVHLTVRDVRERRAAAQQRDRLEGQLRQAQRLEALGRLAGGVAHDFNNLLTIILGNVALLRPSAEERQQRPIDAIEEATGRAADLTRQLLALGRRQVFESDVVDLNQVVSSVQSMLQRLLPEDVAFRITMAADACWVAADRTQLSQIVVNLVNNARDAVRPGGTISIETSLEQSSVVMVISDDGVGMSETTQAHLFEPFFTTKETTGTGLGLATVHGIVSQLGGQITVKSALEQGSQFTVLLPRATPPRQVSASTPAPANVERSSAVRILVVEDDAAVRTVVRAMLTVAGYAVTTADNAEAAQRAATTQQFELVISDVVLNDVSGPMVVAQLREHLPSIKVLFVSGHAEGLIAQRGMLRPGTHFLAKPFTQQVLLAKVEQILAGSSTRHEVPQRQPA